MTSTDPLITQPPGFSNTVRGLILDMDGVLWKDTDPIGDLPAIFAEIRRRGIRFLLATNNATRSVDQYLEKLGNFGVMLEAWQIVNSAEVTAIFLSSLVSSNGRIFVIGESGLFNTLEKYGFKIADHDVQAVVVGLDRQVTYNKLRRATAHIRSGAHFIGTNPDPTLPTPQGLIPGVGAILAALRASTEVEPVIVGKPGPQMYQVAIHRLQTSLAETLAVGDRLETDIAGAQNMGMRSALVLSGVTSWETAQDWSPHPDWIAPDLASLVSLLP